MFAIFKVGTGLGPVLMGLSFDEARSYTFALVVFGVALVCASVLVSRLGRYHFPFAK
jgi:cyanate permease